MILYLEESVHTENAEVKHLKKGTFLLPDEITYAMNEAAERLEKRMLPQLEKIEY